MTKLHLTNIIPSLVYGNLKKLKIVPKSSYFTNIPRFGGNFPSRLTRKCDSWWFGYYIDTYIHLIMDGEDWDNACNLALEATTQHAGKQSVVIDDFLCEEKYFQEICAFVKNKIPQRKYEAEPTLESKHAQGHPDLVMDDTIFDIKTTGRFGKMRLHLVMQLLGYVALARGEGRTINKIGAILPAQDIVLTYDVSDWDSSALLSVINEQAVKLKAVQIVDPFDIIRFTTLLPNIGSHVSRESTLFKTVGAYNYPIQIFLGSRMNAKYKFSDRDLKNVKELIYKEKKNVFVHSPYSINLARIHDDDWVITALSEHLNTLQSIGGKGVVVHIGKKADMDEYDAYMNMHINVSAVAETATPECPLLIETDSGGSLIDDPSELADFILDLPDELQRNVAVCLDTCHVFAAGYDNLETLKMFKKKGVRVGLIHYNDSQYEKGLKKDAHAFPGKGLIGLKSLIDVAEFAITNGICMVRE